MKDTGKIEPPLLVWLPTGRRHVSTLRTVWRILSSATFLVAFAIVAIAVMLFFDIASWWIGAIAPSAAVLATISILSKRKAKNEPLVSKRQAKRHNDFHYAMSWCEKRYAGKVNLELRRTQDDDVMSRLFYCKLVDASITLDLYDDMNETKIGFFTGREFDLVKPIELYVDFVLNEGVGYVFISQSVSRNAKIELIDKSVIKRILRDFGLIEWSIECIDYDEGVKLFILQDDDKRYDEIVYNGFSSDIL